MVAGGVKIRSRHLQRAKSVSIRLLVDVVKILTSFVWSVTLSPAYRSNPGTFGYSGGRSTSGATRFFAQRTIQGNDGGRIGLVPTPSPSVLYYGSDSVQIKKAGANTVYIIRFSMLPLESGKRLGGGSGVGS